MRKFFYFFLFVFIFVPLISHSKLVDQNFPYLDEYNRLVSCEIIDRPFYGQRFWTESKIAAQLSKIDVNKVSAHCPGLDVQSVLNQLKPFLDQQKLIKKNKGTHFKWIDKLSTSYRFLPKGDSNYNNNNRGQINSIINTFREDKQGEVLGLGHALKINSAHNFSYKFQELVMKPAFDVLVSNSFNQIHDYRFTLDEGYLLFDVWHFNILLGRAPVIWGQRPEGGPIFTLNSRAIDQIQITHKNPFRLPWFFKHFGTLKVSTIAGNLGPDQQTFSWNYFAGLSLGIKPIKHLEYNLSHIFQFGGTGNGIPGIIPFTREFLGFFPQFSDVGIRGTNKLTELNMRYYIPSLMGFQGYLSYFMDDSNVSNGPAFKKHFLHNSSYQAGFFISCFAFSCSDIVRAEFTSSSPIAFRHNEFLDGWTINKNIIGDPSGPDSYRFFVTWKRDWSQFLKTRLKLQWISRENKTYTINANGISVDTTFDGPAENRYTVLASHQYQFPQTRYRMNGAIGYEYIKNYQFVANASVNSFLLELGLSYLF
ncbi:hypothetical protein BVY03_02455 [bacterium K02(2017)]|nr:hypothetical protein BVY03_02455 [bacterium K02(2017)]